MIEEEQLKFGWDLGNQYSEFMHGLRSLETYLRNEEDDIKYWDGLSQKLKQIKREHILKFPNFRIFNREFYIYKVPIIVRKLWNFSIVRLWI